MLHADKSHFVHAEELQLSWHIFSAVLHQMESDPDDRPVQYMRGTRGPAVADELAQRYGMRKFGSQRFESNTAPHGAALHPDRWASKKGGVSAHAGTPPAARRSSEAAPRNEWPGSIAAPSSGWSGGPLAAASAGGVPRVASASSIDEPPGFSTQFEETRR